MSEKQIQNNFLGSTSEVPWKIPYFCLLGKPNKIDQGFLA